MPKRLPKPVPPPPEPDPEPDDPFRYATAGTVEDYEVLLVCKTKQNLAAAWMRLTSTRINMGLIDEVDIVPHGTYDQTY